MTVPTLADAPSTGDTGVDARDLQERFTDYAKSTLIPALNKVYTNAKTHVGSVSVMPPGAFQGGVKAMFAVFQPGGSEDGGPGVLEALAGGKIAPITSMYLGAETAITLGAFIQGRSRELPMNIRRELLSELKTELVFVLHESIHSVGPKNMDDFLEESAATHKYGLGPWTEAVTEVATEHDINDILKAAGVDKFDPMILEVEPEHIEGVYSGMVDFARDVLKGLSKMIPGTTYDAELRKLVESGRGPTGLDDIVTRALAARGITDQRSIDTVEQSIADNLNKLSDAFKGHNYDMSELVDAGHRLAQKVLGQIDPSLAPRQQPGFGRGGYDDGNSRRGYDPYGRSRGYDPRDGYESDRGGYAQQRGFAPRGGQMSDRERGDLLNQLFGRPRQGYVVERAVTAPSDGAHSL